MKQLGIEIKTGTEGVGKVLTSDANGVGNWETLSGTTSTPVLLGAIDYVELNAGSASPVFTAIFTGGKPANKMFSEGYAKVIIPFVNYSGTLVRVNLIGTISDNTLNLANKIIVVNGLPSNQSSNVLDISVSISFDDGKTINPLNWTVGKMEVYVVLHDIPL